MFCSIYFFKIIEVKAQFSWIKCKQFSLIFQQKKKMKKNVYTQFNKIIQYPTTSWWKVNIYEIHVWRLCTNNKICIKIPLVEKESHTSQYLNIFHKKHLPKRSRANVALRSTNMLYAKRSALLENKDEVSEISYRDRIWQ